MKSKDINYFIILQYSRKLKQRTINRQKTPSISDACELDAENICIIRANSKNCS